MAAGLWQERIVLTIRRVTSGVGGDGAGAVASCDLCGGVPGRSITSIWETLGSGILGWEGRQGKKGEVLNCCL
jgi:hypothetical protein